MEQHGMGKLVRGLKKYFKDSFSIYHISLQFGLRSLPWRAVEDTV